MQYNLNWTKYVQAISLCNINLHKIFPMKTSKPAVFKNTQGLFEMIIFKHKDNIQKSWKQMILRNDWYVMFDVSPKTGKLLCYPKWNFWKFGLVSQNNNLFIILFKKKYPQIQNFDAFMTFIVLISFFKDGLVAEGNKFFVLA